MTKSITIRKLKQIDHLEFHVPPPGVHILSGTNGSGKSCLLTCLLRICRPNAFQSGFLTSKMSDSLDPFSNAEITYSINNTAVSYKYSGERWSPNPRSQSKLIESFGYSSVIHDAANAERIEPRPEDFKPKNVREAPKSLRDAAKRILSNEKSNDLKIVNGRIGVGVEAFLMLLGHTKPGKLGKPIYYSEQNFSLGEICILKLLRQLETCPHTSLVLIDELELALHPKAQVELLRYLEAIAVDETLTVIFTTHSANLIKSADRDRFYIVVKITAANLHGERIFPFELEKESTVVHTGELADLRSGKILKDHYTNQPITELIQAEKYGSLEYDESD